MKHSLLSIFSKRGENGNNATDIIWGNLSKDNINLKNYFQMKKTILLAMTILVTIFNSCKKDDDSAYQPKGNYVTTGTNNNTVQTFTFTATFTLFGSYWYYYYLFPFGTNINGGVFVYLELPQQQGTYFPLPYTENDIEYYYTFNSSLVAVKVRSASGSTPISNPGPLNYRVVVIPPSSKVAHPNVDYNNYEEVKKTFNLPD